MCTKLNETKSVALPKMLKSPSSLPFLKVICYPFVFGVRPFRPRRISLDGKKTEKGGREQENSHSFRQECPSSLSSSPGGIRGRGKLSVWKNENDHRSARIVDIAPPPIKGYKDTHFPLASPPLLTPPQGL